MNVTNESNESNETNSTNTSLFTEELNWSNTTTPYPQTTTPAAPPGCDVQQWPEGGGCEWGEWRYTGSRRRYGTCIPCVANSVNCGGFSPGSSWSPDAKWSLVC